MYIKTVLVGSTAFGLGMLGRVNTHSPAHALIWISISIGGLSAASPVGWSVPSLIAPRSSVGRGRRNYQLLEPAFRNCRSHHYGLSGSSATIVRLGLRSIKRLPIVARNRRLYIFCWAELNRCRTSTTEPSRSEQKRIRLTAFPPSLALHAR